MKDTIVENQTVNLKERIRIFFTETLPHQSAEQCLIKDVLATSLDKWSLFCIYNLGYYQVLRFNELKKKIDGISSRMLSRTLKKLEQNHIVSRKLYPEVPPRVEYELTDFGSAFAERIIDLSQWYLENYE